MIVAVPAAGDGTYPATAIIRATAIITTNLVHSQHSGRYSGWYPGKHSAGKRVRLPKDRRGPVDLQSIGRQRVSIAYMNFRPTTTTTTGPSNS